MDYRVSSVFPLAERSRARRRLLLRGTGDAASFGETDLSNDQDPPLRVFFDDGSNIDLDFESADARRAHFNQEAIQRLVAGTHPATWLFTGDNLTCEASKTQGWRSFPEHVGARIQNRLGRVLDVVVNTGVRQSKLKNLLETIDWRVMRFDPDVVSLVVGIAESKAGPPGRQSFQNDLVRFVDQLHDFGTVVALNTPHFVAAERHSDYHDLPAFVEIVQRTAELTNALLIDHWSHWKTVESSTTDFTKWYLKDGIHPSSIGHLELARLVFRKFSLVEPQHSVRSAIQHT